MASPRRTASRSASPAKQRYGQPGRCRRRSACSTASSAWVSSRSELERFTAEARKAGPRDLAACAVQGAVGATTVGGALAVADWVGIPFLGTGGIGGVHRGFPSPPDVSADIPTLARARRSSSPRASSPSWTCPRRSSFWKRSAYRCSASARAPCRSSTPQKEARPCRSGSRKRRKPPASPRAHWELGGAGLLLAQAAAREPRRPGPDRVGRVRRGHRERLRAGRDTLRALVPARQLRRPHARGQPGADRRRTRAWPAETAVAYAAL